MGVLGRPPRVPFCRMLNALQGGFRLPAPGLQMFLLAFLLLSLGAARPHGRPPAPPALEAIKGRILAQLGLKEPPTAQGTSDQDKGQEARRLLAQLRGNRTRWAPPSTGVHLLRMEVLSVDKSTPGRPGPLYRLELLRSMALQRRLQVLRAEVSLFKASQGTSQPHLVWPVNVSVYKLTDGASPELLSSQAVWNTSQTISLRDAVEPWLAGPEARLRVGLGFSADVAPWLVTEATAEGKETVPLMLETREGGRPRRARHLEEDCGKADGKCCLRSRRVSFEAIGWSDWVVAPSSYAMRFCQGSCPHNYKPASIHAQIKARLHSLSGETPAPCCVPAAYEPMVIMHYGDGGEVVSQLFDNMIVTRCHCA